MAIVPRFQCEGHRLSHSVTHVLFRAQVQCGVNDLVVWMKLRKHVPLETSQSENTHVCVLLADENKQQPNNDLQCDGQRQQDNEWDVEAVLRPNIEDSLQLGRVGHEQSHVQHTLGRRLLRGVVVHVDARPLGWRGLCLHGGGGV